MNENNEIKSETKELAAALHSLAKYKKREISLSWNFWRGVFYGFGLFVGSALLAAILIYVLAALAAGDNNVAHFFRNIYEGITNFR